MIQFESDSSLPLNLDFLILIVYVADFDLSTCRCRCCRMGSKKIDQKAHSLGFHLLTRSRLIIFWFCPLCFLFGFHNFDFSVCIFTFLPSTTSFELSLPHHFLSFTATTFTSTFFFNYFLFNNSNYPHCITFSTLSPPKRPPFSMSAKKRKLEGAPTMRILKAEDLCLPLRCIVENNDFPWIDAENAFKAISNVDRYSTAEKKRRAYLLLSAHLSQADLKMDYTNDIKVKLILFLKFISLIFYVGGGGEKRPQQHSNPSSLRHSKSRKVKYIRKMKKEKKQYVEIKSFFKANYPTIQANEHCLILVLDNTNITNEYLTGAEDCRILSDYDKLLAGSYLLWRMFEDYLKANNNDFKDDNFKDEDTEDELNKDEQKEQIDEVMLKSQNQMFKDELAIVKRQLEEANTSKKKTEKENKRLKKESESSKEAIILANQMLKASQKEVKSLRQMLALQHK